MSWLMLNAGAPELFQYPITLIIIAITCFVSWRAWTDESLAWRLIFNTEPIQTRNEWYRFFSSGLIHADGMHLAFNMISFWSFGQIIEKVFQTEEFFGPLWGAVYYVVLYVSALAASSVYSFYKHKNNPYYNALGASGAVSAIIFAFILIAPTARLALMFIPIPMPAVLMGALYLAYSSYMGKRGGDNIGHDAHFWGSVWGFALTLALKPELLEHFISEVASLLG